VRKSWTCARRSLAIRLSSPGIRPNEPPTYAPPTPPKTPTAAAKTGTHLLSISTISQAQQRRRAPRRRSQCRTAPACVQRPFRHVAARHPVASVVHCATPAKGSSVRVGAVAAEFSELLVVAE
jgi:hypothetical protein